MVSTGRSPETEPETVPGVVLAQALSTPDAVAVESAGHRTTYRQLAAHAYGLARHLRRRGVRAGDLVAVAVPRGVELVPTLLGVQLAGAAYVPLDPTHPPERSNHVLADAGARVLVTADASGRPGLRADVRVELDDVPVQPWDGSPAGPPPGSAAYAIYTSGSTGRPKGVRVPHRALANVVRSIRELVGIPDRVVFPATTTVSFDIAALELFLPLCAGGTVVVVPEDEAADPHRLAGTLARTGTRYLQATPVTWRLLLESGWSPPPGFTVLCGGERLPAELRDRLTGADVVLWDLYGPTETTVWSAVTRYERGRPPVCRPVAGTSLHLLDERFAPVPAGVPGELYVGGTGVADGYLGRPVLTAERFVADPAGAGGTRLYRTGDVARRHEDGRIEIVGRIDDQLKIRGFRVEPGEIENVLASHPDVAEAAVCAVEGPGGTPDLVAYVRPAAGADPPSPGRLRAYLTRALPSYLVPARYVVVDALPRTPNGKLDRAALPLAAVHVPAGNGTAAPGPRTGRRVAETLARLLRRADVGPHDDFFALGGNSMLAVLAVHELNAELRSDLAVTALLEVRTAFGLAELLDGDTGGTPDPPPPSSRTVESSGPLSPAQWTLWQHQQREPGSTAYHEAVVVRLCGPPDAAALEATVTGLLARHDVLRTRYERTGTGRPLAVVEPATRVRPELVTADPAALLAADLAEPFDLAAGPPVRVRAVRTGPEECTLFLVLHHIAADDRSRELIAGQLRAGYRGRAVPSPRVQYGQYAAWRREAAASPARQRHLDHWRTALARLVPAELRTDRPRPAGRDRRAGTVAFTVRPAVASAVRDVAAARDATVFMALLAGLHRTLAGHVTGTDLTVGTLAGGRDLPELSDAVGVFTNPVVTRVDVAGDPGYLDVLDRVRESTLAAFEHAEAPFQDVVAAVLEAADVRLDPFRNPLFDVMFTVQDAADPAGLPLPSAPGAGFDLSCRLTGRADGGFDGRLVYATQLFDEPTVARLASGYVALLEQVAEQVAEPGPPSPHRSPYHVTGQRRPTARTVARD